MEEFEQKSDQWLPKSVSSVTDASNFDYVSAMLERTSGDKALATVLFNKLFFELQEQVQIIEKALLSHDLSLAEVVTHKLHGSVSFCGCSNIQALAKNLEVSLSEETFQIISINFFSMKKNILEFMQLKKNILARLGALTE